MSIAASFSTSQTLGNASVVTVTDTSTGTDGAIVERRLYLQKANGDYLVPEGTITNFIVWDYTDPSISVDVLKSDKALYVTVEWVDNLGAVLYTGTVLSLFTLYSKEFLYYLTQQQSARPDLIQDNIYFSNKAKLWTYVMDAEGAVSIGNDIFNAQSALDAANFLITSENKFF